MPVSFILCSALKILQLAWLALTRPGLCLASEKPHRGMFKLATSDVFPRLLAVRVILYQIYLELIRSF